MLARRQYLPLLAAPLFWYLPALGTADPSVSSASPAAVQPGQNITLVGANLAHSGYTAELRYTKKYVASGETPTGIVSATSQSATQLVFSAPTNMQPTGLVLRYHTSSKGTTAFAGITLTDTSLASRTFTVPGRVDVLEAPVVLTGSQGVVVSQSAAGQLTGLQLLLPGAMEIRGRNLVPPPGAQATVTFNGTSMPQSGAPHYDATGGGKDIIPVQVTEPNASAIGTLTVTTPGGAGSNTTFLVLRRPRVTAVEEIDSRGVVVAAAAGRLVRGRRYQIRGTELAFPSSPPFALDARVKLGTTDAASVVTVDGGHVQFTVPTTLPGSSAELLVNTAFGFAGSGGQFSVSDPGATPPALADVVIAPSPTTWGTPLSATIAFAGSVTAGADLGSVIVSSLGPNDFVGLPMTVPITSNPQVVTIPTQLRSISATRTLRVRLTRFTGAVDSLDRQVQLVAPSLTGLTLSATSVAGGETVTANASFDFPVGPGGSCGNVPFTQPDLRIEVTLSDTSVQNSNLILGTSTGVCVRRNPTQILLLTKPVTATRTVQVTAQLGQVTRTASFTVLPPALVGLKVDRPTLTSMQTAVGTLTMSAPLPGAAVLLSSSDPAVSVPAKFVLGTGLTTPFSITTLPVSSPRTVTISAAVNGVTQSTTVTLNPLQITSVTMSPSAVRAGSNSAGTIGLNATIDLPFTATLASSDPSVATVPQTVGFAATQNAAVFNVQTVAPQAQAKTVTITATFSITLPNGTAVTTTQAGTLTVNP
jgi:hypothetical protein